MDFFGMRFRSKIHRATHLAPFLYFRYDGTNPRVFGFFGFRQSLATAVKRRHRLFVISSLVLTLLGCYAGTVKPLLDRPDFKAGNQPVRTLRILLVTDGSYRKEEIEKFVSKCSPLVEAQVGIRLQIVAWRTVRWEGELKNSFRMIVRIAADTWKERETFDITLAPVYFDQKMEGMKIRLGCVDSIFSRYVFIKELEPNTLLHEIFHCFLPEREHSEHSVMMPERPLYGREWYWLSPAEREVILGNKWRDFNVMPLSGEEKRAKAAAGWFYYSIGSLFLQRKETEEAVPFFNQSIEMNPAYAPGYIRRARAYELKGDYGRAVSDYDKAIEVDPKDALAYNNLAWLLASGDRADLRDGKKALELALKACELSGWGNPSYVDTLASAYARVGEFQNAVKWQQKAIDATTFTDEAANAEARKRLRLYRMSKPWPPN